MERPCKDCDYCRQDPMLERMEKGMAHVWWQLDDVLDRAQTDTMTKADAREILEGIEETLRDRMVEAGWDVIDEAVQEWLEERVDNL